MGQLGQHVGGGGSDEDKVRPVGHSDVLHAVLKVPVKGVHQGLVAGELLKGDGGDKLGGVLGHNDLDVGVLLDQGGGQGRRLVAGDAAGDPQHHCLSG